MSALVLNHFEYYLPVSKHFAETCLLIWSDCRGRLEIDIKVCIDGVVPEVILFEHGILEFIAPLLDILRRTISTGNQCVTSGSYVDLGVVNLKSMHVVVVFVNLIIVDPNNAGEEFCVIFLLRIASCTRCPSLLRSRNHEA